MTTNGDPQFTQTLINAKLIDPNSTISIPEQRRRLFYRVCIPTRLFLYSLIALYHKNRAVQWVLLILCLLSGIKLTREVSYNKTHSHTHWWNKTKNAVISFAIVINTVFALIYSKNYKYSFINPILLFLSLFSGVIQSFFVNFK